MLDAIYPRMLGVRQRFSIPSPVDLAPALDREWNVIADRVPPGARIAVAVGSRGITNLAAIVAQVISKLKAAGAQPFIIPAMGSHGGATPEGQTEILAEYGVTAARLGVPIEAAMEVERVGATEDGVEVFVSVAALRADGVIIINRIKPHTDFSGALGSGVMKMMVIGLGKRQGAATFHAAACRLGYEHVIRTVARVIIREAPVLGGVAIIENQVHQTSGIHLLPRENIEAGENELFLEARRLMPRLPLEEIDFLIVDQLGKNISGAGMDPNIIGRSVHGYSSFLGQKNMPPPFIRRIFVRDMTAETHGNGIGIGLADVTTDRFVRGLDRKAMYINALTSLTPQGAKLPVHFATDKEAIGQVLNSLGLSDPTTAIVVRIRDTLTLDELEISESAQELVARHEALRIVRPAAPMEFDATGNLAPLGVPAGSTEDR